MMFAVGYNSTNLPCLTSVLPGNTSDFMISSLWNQHSLQYLFFLHFQQIFAKTCYNVSKSISTFPLIPFLLLISMQIKWIMKTFFMPPKELWRAYSNSNVLPSVRLPALCPVHISYILWGRNSKYDVWMHLGMLECSISFSGHCDLDLWPSF